MEKVCPISSVSDWVPILPSLVPPSLQFIDIDVGVFGRLLSDLALPMFYIIPYSLLTTNQQTLKFENLLFFLIYQIYQTYRY